MSARPWETHPTIKLEQAIASGRVRVSPRGEMSGAVEGDILDPSTWVVRPELAQLRLFGDEEVVE